MNSTFSNLNMSQISASASPQLPIDAIKAEFLSTLPKHNTIILSAPPGAGKSTALPLWLLDEPCLAEQKIIMLQPRRLATKTIATYLADQLNEPVGQTIGYRMRNDTKVSSATKLEIVTEGILTRMIQQDGELSGVGLVIFDEFHERSLHADLAFALSRDIQLGLRDDLKLMLMSATLNNDYLNEQLTDAVFLESEGRSYPVDVQYCAPTNSTQWRDHAVSEITKFSASHQGSILVFLPGVADIKYLADKLASKVSATQVICPLYGELDINSQQQAIAPSAAGIDKIVLSTNIAETSLTIDGINAVIDCGLEKVAIFDNDSLFNQLKQQSISKASATQRAGRAGRLMPGKCLRLYGKDDYERRNKQSTSEIQHSDLLPFLIEISRWGVSQIDDLPLIEQPTTITVERAWQELRQLEIVNNNNQLTQHGQQVAQLPCHPRFAHMLIKASNIELQEHVYGLTYLACLIAALLEERDIYSREQSIDNSELNHRIYDLVHSHQKNHGLYRRILLQAKQLARLIKTKVNSELPMEYSGLLVAFCYPERIAKQSSRASHYLLANGKGGTLNEADQLIKEPLLSIARLHSSAKPGQKSQMNITLATELSQALFNKYFSDQIKTLAVCEYDDKQRKIVNEQRTVFGKLVLNSVIQNTLPSGEQVAQMWITQIQKQGLTLLKFSEKCQQLLARWRWLSLENSAINLPTISDQYLIENLATWLAPYLVNVKSLVQLKQLELTEILLNLLDYQQQQQLNNLAPKYFTAPTNNKYLIDYQTEQPTVSLPMQAVYGLTDNPSINQGKAPLTLALLSPAKRPLQITQDLKQFWQGSYDEVKKEMKGRYPKHFWPDDPANALPTTKIKKHLK